MFRLLWAFAACACAAAASAADPTPMAPRDVDIRDVRIVKTASLTLLHTSLEGLASVPTEGVTIQVACLVGKDSAMEKCKTTETATPWDPAAIKRAVAMEIRATDGESIISGRVTLPIRIQPSDRFENASVDFSKGDTIVFEKVPNGMDLARYYPSYPLRHDIEALIDMVCVVKDDFLVTCPDVRVYPNAKKDDQNVIDAFTLAAHRIAGLFLSTPVTKGGQSPVGIAFRRRIKVVMR
jgi:hypothetical protein